MLDGNKQQLETDSIDCIVLWNPKYPDSKHLIKPFKLEFVNLETGEITGPSEYSIWFYCQYVGDNASYWVQIANPSFKKDKLKFTYGRMFPPSGMFYVLKKGSETPVNKPNKTKDVKTWARIYFKDDPEMIGKLDAGEYDGSDWGYKYVDLERIVNDYNPKR